MSITPNVLRNKRKNELKEIASDLGLNTKGLRSELEERIRIYLENSDNNKTEEDATPSKSTPRRSKRSISSSNKTKSRKDISLPPNGDRNSSDEENPSVSSESESKQVIERTTLLEKSTQYVTNQLTFEPSQQDVTVNANYIRTQNTSETEIIEPSNLRGLPNDGIFRVNNVQDSLVQLRDNISNSSTFCKAVIFMELAVFLYFAIDRDYKIASIPMIWISDSEEPSTYDVHVPNIFVLMEWHQFWRPLISFIFYLLLLPLGFSYIFNLEPQRYLYSPLTFSVAQYAIFMVSVSVSLPNFDWAEDVRYFIPESLIYAGAWAGVIFALYESILDQ